MLRSNHERSSTQPAALLEFLDTHGPVWLARASELGLSPQQAQQVIDAAAEARLRLNNASAARTAAISLTEAADRALAAAHFAAASAIRTIKHTATVTGDAGVYSAAQIAPPRTSRPGTMEPPSQPKNVRATISASGAVMLSWSCTQPINARGTVYIVQRRLPRETTFSPIATTGAKRFADRTLPVASLAAGPVLYTVQAQRGRAAGPESTMCSVEFGNAGASVTGRLAA
ncbi:MAG: fibronectin type III domain-containing protein [Phycisphaerales bacterium]|nr:fibronectin type III domain-containing protein [Phycisphaerales bacterium]